MPRGTFIIEPPDGNAYNINNNGRRVLKNSVTYDTLTPGNAYYFAPNVRENGGIRHVYSKPTVLQITQRSHGMFESPFTKKRGYMRNIRPVVPRANNKNTNNNRSNRSNRSTNSTRHDVARTRSVSQNRPGFTNPNRELTQLNLILMSLNLSLTQRERNAILNATLREMRRERARESRERFMAKLRRFFARNRR